MTDWSTLSDAVHLGGWVIYPLTVLAMTALTITLDRAWVFWRFARTPHWAGEMVVQEGITSAGRPSATDPQIDEATTHQGHSLAELTARLSPGLPSQHAFMRISRLLDDTHAPLWRIESRVEVAAAQIERDMSHGLWLLETIVTAAPLLGLLGTIVGMMHSFKLVGGDGLVNPSGVTGGVAQALIATAIGLVIALVALFAFNFFSRRVDRLMDELESFATEALSDMRLAAGQAS